MARGITGSHVARGRHGRPPEPGARSSNRRMAPAGTSVGQSGTGRDHRGQQWLPTIAHYGLRKLARQTGYRATLNPVPRRRWPCRGDAARLRWLTSTVGAVGVHDPYTSGYTAMVRVRAEAFLLLTDAAQDDKVAGLGRLYAVRCQGSAIGGCRSSSPASRIRGMRCSTNGPTAVIRSPRRSAGTAPTSWTPPAPPRPATQSLIAITLDTGKARAALRAPHRTPLRTCSQSPGPAKGNTRPGAERRRPAGHGVADAGGVGV